MRTETKPWGAAVHYLESYWCQVSVITVVAGGYSSIHLHERKHNQFTIASGKMIVREFGEDGRMVQAWMLDASSPNPVRRTVVIPKGVRHQFFCPEPARVVETYFVDDPSEELVLGGDIIRFSENGVEPQPIQT